MANGNLSGQPKFPGIKAVIHGNGAVAHVMGHVCGGVIGYPITPSTEISEIYESYRADGGMNVWGKHPFFFEPEGEHSAQSGALGAAMTGGLYTSNASSSQGILYGLESHYVTAGKKVGGFVLHVAARVVSKHSLNVMAGHDDVYSMVNSGYTILFGSNPQEAADLAAISYKVSALSLIAVANAMDGFATSHMQSEALLPEPQLLQTFLGDPEERIPCPTLAQEMLFGAKGRVYQLKSFVQRNRTDFDETALGHLLAHLDAQASDIEKDNDGGTIGRTLEWIPEPLHAKWGRQWRNAHQKGTRQRVPALVDHHNPGSTGPVQNQPDFQGGCADHRTHFAGAVPGFIRQAMEEYSQLTGRVYTPVRTYRSEDADWVVVSMGSVTDDCEAMVDHLRSQGRKVGSVSLKQFMPFPEAEIVAALQGKRAVTVLERSDSTMLSEFVANALFKAVQNHRQPRHDGIPSLAEAPTLCTGIFGLGGHDLQPRHLVAAFSNMEEGNNIPLFYLGSRFFEDSQDQELIDLQQRLRQAYPETVKMAFATDPNPHLLPHGALRVRFHSVGGYGTIATGKLLTDILAGVMELHSKSAPKYGSEKSGAPTNFYITLSPEPIKITNAELEDVEIVLSPDHKVFEHTNPLRGLIEGGTFIMQSNESPLEVWKGLPATARRLIRERGINFYVVDAFSIAKENAPTQDLQVRMMGIAFIGAMCGNVSQVVGKSSEELLLTKIQNQIQKKFGGKGDKVVASNMSVIKRGILSTRKVEYNDPAFVEAESGLIGGHRGPGVAISASMAQRNPSSSCSGLFDANYYAKTTSDPLKAGTIGESPVYPGHGLHIPIATAAWKDKGLFRLDVPDFVAHLCTGCMECAVACPDAAIPNTVHEIHDLLTTGIAQLDVPPQQQHALSDLVIPLSNVVREIYRKLPSKDPKPFSEVVADAGFQMDIGMDFGTSTTIRENFSKLVDLLSKFQVAKTRPFFDSMEKTMPGSGGLYSVAVDPWKCTGCLECVDVCGPGALVEKVQTRELARKLEEGFTFLSRLPNTPSRFFSNALTPSGDTKRMMLDHRNYYALTGGHGACRGCGEVTAVRLFTGMNRALHSERYRQRIVQLEQLIQAVNEKLSQLDGEPVRRQRLQNALRVMEKSLYNFESGPTGNGPANAIIANATGCTSVYGSTSPFNPYTDPWVNSLFHDTAPVAKGIFEGLAQGVAQEYKAVRVAQLELADGYDAAQEEFLKYFGWTDFSHEEKALLPTVMTLGGDGSQFDIGFGALSRILTTQTPLKCMVVDTGAYSNTGGQASTSSFVGQDSDLARHGRRHPGKTETRKEFSLLAAFHPKVYVVQTSVGVQNHFLKSILDLLNYQESPALLTVYTPCQPEHGIGDNASTRRAREAVQSRMNPVFVHNPLAGDTLAERFSIEGNPDPSSDWSKTTISYEDVEGHPQIKEIPFTPADFAAREGRFKKHFTPVRSDDELREISEYIALSREAREGLTPFIWTTDKKNHLARLAVSTQMVSLTDDCLRNWRSLQTLSGLQLGQMAESHRREMGLWKERYEQAVKDREQSMDSIARGMSELASGARASAAGIVGAALVGAGVLPAEAGAKGEGKGSGKPLVVIADADMSKCTNCKKCYLDVSALFENVTIMHEGKSKEVSRVKQGVLKTVELTPDLVKKAERVANDCDAAIIQFNRPA
ncbi:MAG: pyruvate flavodoxin/ferredoxin oxidoreductase-like [Magnetococcales bacterium]|nr:pyruvate flavodoxin/ferredoxin oxidoreductase-like [Magnetococcales bacterium]HIJ85399.1 pyruvate-flavodoxin oxidoreductase [Magnetococcales bacterium]